MMMAEVWSVSEIISRRSFEGREGSLEKYRRSYEEQILEIELHHSPRRDRWEPPRIQESLTTNEERVSDRLTHWPVPAKGTMIWSIFFMRAWVWDKGVSSIDSLDLWSSAEGLFRESIQRKAAAAWCSANGATAGAEIGLVGFPESVATVEGTSATSDEEGGSSWNLYPLLKRGRSWPPKLINTESTFSSKKILILFSGTFDEFSAVLSDEMAPIPGITDFVKISFKPEEEFKKLLFA
jgi:hypothetical protein